MFLEKQIKELSLILKNEDLKKYAGDAFLDFIKAVITGDLGAGISAGIKVKDILLFHLPTALFWGKMEKYLWGTYSCFEDQVKMAAKFYDGEKKYTEFVKRQIYLINEIDDDKKIDYFAALTRCFLLTDLQLDLYFKLAKYLVMCTPEELDFLRNISMSCRETNSALISSLYQYGLFTHDENIGVNGARYILSDFGKALKQNSLNYEESFSGEKRRTSYGQLAPLSIAEAIVIDDLRKI